MKDKTQLMLMLALGTALLLAACQQATEQPMDSMQMANPASVYCNAAGYHEENHTDASGGEYGVCIFPDGTECQSWAFFQGECGQDKSFCAQKGGTLKAMNGVATCIFPDGSSCPEFAYSQGNCAPAQ